MIRDSRFISYNSAILILALIFLEESTFPILPNCLAEELDDNLLARFFYLFFNGDVPLLIMKFYFDSENSSTSST